MTDMFYWLAIWLAAVKIEISNILSCVHTFYNPMLTVSLFSVWPSLMNVLLVIEIFYVIGIVYTHYHNYLKYRHILVFQRMMCKMNFVLLLLLQPSKVTATPVMSPEEAKKRELASALFGGRGGINREGLLSVSNSALCLYQE